MNNHGGKVSEKINRRQLKAICAAGSLSMLHDLALQIGLATTEAGQEELAARMYLQLGKSEELMQLFRFVQAVGRKRGGYEQLAERSSRLASEIGESGVVSTNQTVSVRETGGKESAQKAPAP